MTGQHGGILHMYSFAGELEHYWEEVASCSVVLSCLGSLPLAHWGPAAALRSAGGRDTGALGGKVPECDIQLAQEKR